MSSGSFGTVNATGLNVTGILQASQIVTSKPMQVSNLTVSGDLVITGNIISSTLTPIQYYNLTQVQSFDVAGIYNQNNTERYYNTPNAISVQPYTSVSTMKIKDSNGLVSNLLTVDTPYSDPVATNYFGKEAPLVKIEDNGSLSYINVASNTITQICNTFVPSALDDIKTFIVTHDKTWESSGYFGDSTIIKHSDVVESLIKINSALIKRGFPIPDKNGIKDYENSHIFYNTMFIEGHIYSPELFGSENMTIGLDINPYLNGSGTMDFFIQGGVMRPMPLGIRSLDWTGHVVIPKHTVSVTTNPLVYESSILNNTNCVYLNTNLNILNINIVDFGGYTSILPVGNVGSTSNLTCSPASFKASLGFFRTPSTVSTTPEFKTLSNTSPDITFAQFDGLSPVQSSLSSAEYLVQVSDTLVFTYHLSNSEELKTTTIQRISSSTNPDTGAPGDYCTAIVLPRYEYGLNTNIIIQRVLNVALEQLGFPLTRGTTIGDNRNTPYLTETNATSGRALDTLQNFNGIIESKVVLEFLDLTKGPDEQSLLSSDDVKDSSNLIDFITLHEYSHALSYNIGLNSTDFENNIFDDEWLNTYLSLYLINGKVNSTKLMPRWFDYLNGKLLHNLSRGAGLPYVQIEADGKNYLLEGTDFDKKYADCFFPDTSYGQSKYYLSSLSYLITETYDPNAQVIKLFMYYMAKKLSYASNSDILRIYYSNRNRTINPSIVTGPWKQAISGTQMKYNDDTIISDASLLQLEMTVALSLSRNNSSIPDKYKTSMPILWYDSTYSPGGLESLYISGGDNWLSSNLNMATWDFVQTNEDSNGVGDYSLNDSIIPWWPREINPAGADIYGRLVGNGEGGAMTQDCSYKATCISTAPFVSSITRHMWSLETLGYAFSNAHSNVTVSLTEPTVGGTNGDYNQDIHVVVFKYIPDRCVSNVNGTTGAFLMKGPFTLSSGGTTSVTIDFTDVMVDGAHPGYIVGNNSSNITAGMLSFNHVFPYSIDDGTVYIPSEHAVTRATALGMTQGAYQPVTKMLILNGQIDDIELTDGDILDKLWFDQVKPSCITITVV